MSEKVYLLMVGSNTFSPDVIYSRDSDLKIAVYYTDNVSFAPTEGEIQLYAYSGQSLMIFETIDIHPDDALEMLAAIKWYMAYIGHPEIEILPDDPRMNAEFAVAL
jgi:hypothetical protein